MCRCVLREAGKSRLQSHLYDKLPIGRHRTNADIKSGRYEDFEQGSMRMDTTQRKVEGAK